MLTFHLCTADIGLDWRLSPDGFARGQSFVRPFRHRALEEVAVASGSRFLVFVRERCAGISGPAVPAGAETGLPTAIDDQRFDLLSQELRNWPLQWRMLVVHDPPPADSRNGDQALATIETGHWGTAPTFFVAERENLWGDWDAARLLPRLARTSLDPVRATRYVVEYANPYARTTLFRGLQLLTERGRAVWAGQSGSETLSISYPEPWFRPRAGVLREGADPVLAIATIVSSSLRRWVVSEEHLGTEVSGGLDSAIVASTASALCGKPLRSYGVALMGLSSQDQSERRAEIVQRFGLVDTEIPISSFLPLAPGSCRLDGRAPVVPWEEGYHEVFYELLRRAAANGTEVMMTGFGGDELCGLRPSEIRALRGESAVVTEPEASPENAPAYLTPSARATLAEELDLPPRAACSESSVECAAYGAPRYMRHGIWPVHPLCTPELVHFCARVPPEWRYRRKIERELLARRDCSRRVTHPSQSDDFSWALAATLRGAARPLVKRLLADSALHEFGIIDGSRMMRAYEAWCDSGPRDEAVQYFAAAVTELCLQGMR